MAYTVFILKMKHRDKTILPKISLSSHKLRQLPGNAPHEFCMAKKNQYQHMCNIVVYVRNSLLFSYGFHLSGGNEKKCMFYSLISTRYSSYGFGNLSPCNWTQTDLVLSAHNAGTIHNYIDTFYVNHVCVVNSSDLVRLNIISPYLGQGL